MGTPHCASQSSVGLCYCFLSLWPGSQEPWSTPLAASGRRAVLKDVSSRLPQLGGAEKEGAEDFAQRESCQPGPPVTPTHLKRVCLLRQKTKYSPSWGSRMSLGSSPGRTLSRPLCCLLSNRTRAGGGNTGAEEGNASPGQGQVGALQGRHKGHGAFGRGCGPFHSTSFFLHGPGTVLFREGRVCS